MKVSVQWLSRYLTPSDLSPDEAVRVLEATSFPIESVEPAADTDAVLDVEVTSNRGDCLSHLGLAREIAVATSRRLTPPTPGVTAPKGNTIAGVTIENRVGPLCPRFTARVIRGVKVGPSPAWLKQALERIGLRSINNIVDVSNYVLMELGHPSHTFDLGTIRGGKLTVRPAVDGEKLAGLDGKTHTLKAGDMAIADADRVVSLAGIVGGVETGVTERTTDVLLELATWDPATVRRTARRLEVRTDAGHRFERIVDAREIPAASARCVELILQVAGGTLDPGMIDLVHGALEPARKIVVRPARVEFILGKAIPTDECVRLLSEAGFSIARTGSDLACTVPHFRPDITREIDVIEEIARLHGIDRFDVSPRIAVPLEVNHPQEWESREKAVDQIGASLTGAGFFETVTFSFLSERDARPFVPSGMRLLKIDEARRRDTPYLRPSVIPSLLACRRANQDGGVIRDGGVRLFEVASVFAEEDDGAATARRTRERRVLAILADAGTDAGSRQEAVRTVRGAIERMVRDVGGKARRVVCAPDASGPPFAKGGTFARIKVDGADVGWVGVPGAQAIAPWGLDQGVAVAELDLGSMIALWPPRDRVDYLPAFPAIERDLSVVVDESVPWMRIESVITGVGAARMEGATFVGTFRGKQVGAGKKSVTVRLRFRDASRTLRHEEIDGEVARVLESVSRATGATLRQ